MTVAGARPLFDPQPLRELAGATNPKLVRELVEVFLRDSPARLAEMRAAVRDGDAPRLCREAHALGGNSAILGATALAELCELLEEPHDGVARAVLVERVGEAYAQTIGPLKAGTP
ncbi:MAG TPA: Hpt domain-containing protein [Thermoleophilaceae bacterium]